MLINTRFKRYNYGMEATDNILTQVFQIDGMTCINCQNHIEKELKNTAGITDASVNYRTGKATVSFDKSIMDFNGIKAAVESMGYKAAEGEGKTQFTQIAGTLVIIIALYMLFRMFSASSLAAAFPVARAGMGYGMVLLIGLVTSVHCIAMCGGINLSQTLKTKSPCAGEPVKTSFDFHLLTPGILYNAGRLISYTAVGVVVGALGSVITVSGRFQGAILLLAGIFMLVMGINMLGFFPGLRRFIPQMPKIFAKKIDEQKTGRGPLVIGFLNGFIPCGPLQAMQLYALSTGSPIRGGISMFLFCLGTTPLMFTLGAAGGILSGVKGQAFSRRVVQAGAVLVAAMGLVMFTNGWNLAGLYTPLDRAAAYIPSMKNEGGAFAPKIKNGVQIVNSTLLSNRYPAITVQQGIPVRWNINAPKGSINGCNNRFIIREYGIEHTFAPGENIIEFLPERTGRFSYSCWMGMIRSSITVVAEGEIPATASEPSTAPVPAGVNISTDKIALAQASGNFQTVGIRLTDDGFEPAIVVMQRNQPTLWNINVDSLDPGSASLIFPAYYKVIETNQGDNTIQIIPGDDFDFSTGDNVFYGYVKVVDDINNVDIQAVKAEVTDFETLIYPEAHFETADAGGCACCR